MKKEIFSNLGLRANSASNIEVVTEAIDPRYRLVESDKSISTETGHLELFRVEPLNAGLPIFSARWDQKANSVDADLLGDAAASRLFRDEAGGYSGHHSRIVSDSPRIYSLKIQTPTGMVFSGAVTLNIELGVLIRESYPCSDFAEAIVRPASTVQKSPGISGIRESLRRPGFFRSLIAFAAGVCLSVLSVTYLRFLQPPRSALDKGQLPSHGPAIWMFSLKIQHIYAALFTWPWIVIMLLLFVMWAVRSRNEEKGWTVAFVAGMLVVVGLNNLILQV